MTVLSASVDSCVNRPARGSVLIVEDHQLLAQSLSFALMAEGFEVTIAELDSRGGVLEALDRSGADIVLLDLDLGGAIGDGLSLVSPLRDRHARVVVVSGSTDRPRLAGCLERGAVAVLAKSTPYQQLVDAVVNIAAGRPVMPEAERHAMLAELRAWRARQRQELAPFETLTAREAQVLGGAHGWSGLRSDCGSMVRQRGDRTNADPRRAHQARRVFSAGRGRARATGWLAPSPGLIPTGVVST